MMVREILRCRPFGGNEIPLPTVRSVGLIAKGQKHESAAVTERRGFAIFTTDHDFALYAAAIPVKLYTVDTTGR